MNTILISLLISAIFIYLYKKASNFVELICLKFIHDNLYNISKSLEVYDLVLMMIKNPKNKKSLTFLVLPKKCDVSKFQPLKGFSAVFIFRCLVKANRDNKLYLALAERCIYHMIKYRTCEEGMDEQQTR